MRRPFLILSSLLITSCATPPSTTVTAMNYSLRDPAQTQIEGTSYLSLNLPWTPYDKMRQDLEKRLGFSLKHRGEAHITIISPPEFAKLKSRLTMKDLIQLADTMDLKSNPYKLICIGKGAKSPNEQAYYAVVESEKLFDLRKKIQTLFQQKGGKTEDFNAELYYPHVTLGFTARDLHFEDGVIKDASSCIYTLRPDET